MLVVLLGPPGSGKGTQAEFVCQKHNLFHFSTGNILRDEVEKKTIIGKQIESIINAGKLINDNIIIKIVDNQISSQLNKSGVLFDGFPRNYDQAKSFNELLNKNKLELDCVIQLSVDLFEIQERIKKRKLEEGRKDDSEEILTSRLKVYTEETEPLLEFYKKQGKLHVLDGMKSIENVSKNIDSIILSLKWK